MTPVEQLTGIVANRPGDAIVEPLPALAVSDLPAAPGGAGPGFRFSASGPPARLREYRQGEERMLCIGSPYATSGSNDIAAVLGGLRSGRESLLSAVGGEFALACFDAKEHVLLLASDHFASVPIYYAVADGRIVFSTQLEQVRGILGNAPQVDPQAIYDYLFFSVVPGARSVFAGIHKLPPASVLTYRDGKARISRYWEPDFRREGASPERLREQAFEAISGAVRRRVNLPDLGCFLSGGLDSSSVCGLAARHASSRVRAFTIGFDVPNYDESRYAQVSARHFGLELNEKRICAADVTACLDRVIAAFPEPFGNESAISAYLCAEFARAAGVRNMLAGDGGDELFAGNARYQKQSVFNIYQELPAWLRRGAVDPLAALARRAPGPLRKPWSYVEQARVPLPDRLFSYNLLARNPPGNVLTREFLDSVDAESPYRYARSVFGEPRHGDSLDRMLYLDWALTLTDNDLPKVRVTGNLAGISVHFPMLDPEVLRVSTLVPSGEKLTLGKLRKFYKEAFTGFLPAEVIGKPKHGFGVPVGIWLKEHAPLRDRMYQRLRSLGERDIVRRDFLDDLVRLQQTDHAVYYGALMWSLFMLEEWLLAHAT